MAMPGEKAKNFGNTIATLMKYIKPYRWAIIVTLIFSIAATAFAIVGPKLMDNATNILFTGVMGKMVGTPGAGVDFAAIGGICLTLLGLYIAGTAFNYAQGWIMSGIAMKMTYQLRQQIAEKVSRLPLKYFDKKTHGEVISLVANDADAIGNTLSMNLSSIVMTITSIVGFLAMMFWISWAMTLVALVIMPISLILVSIIIKKSQKYFKKNWDFLGHVNGHIEEMFGSHNTMKAYNGEEKSIKQFDCFEYRALRRGVEVAIPFHGDDAGDELRQQPGVCRRGYHGRLPGGEGHDSGRRYPRFCSLREELYADTYPDLQYRQPAADDGSRRRAGVRFPE